MKNLIIQEAGTEVYDFIKNYTDFCSGGALVMATTTKFNIDNQPEDAFRYIINLKRINDIRRVNKFFESINSKLPEGGIFIDCAETYVLRKERIMKKFPPVVNHIYYFNDWIFKRLFPKLMFTKQLYFAITSGRNRVLSKAETLGRLYSCGFEVIDEAFINGLFYFAARKIKEPAFDYNPTYGPLVRLNRIGKEGKIIKVYKMRTMHACSEYIQGYVFDKNNLQDGGKIKDDFRVTTLGRIMRKIWLDELPMLINVLKGDMKIVGVRPLSRHYYSLYCKEMQALRIVGKPGLVPPFYADMPKTFEEIEASERKYLEEYQKHPFRTDWKYFWKAWRNIVFKKARSG
jgi:lipopolysaccharide/colanic/teichoic acid biosynthesis glycosyltransferase